SEVGGMRRGQILTFLLLSVSLVWAAPLAAQTSAPPAYERGKALYNTHCAVCHGVDGRADTPVGHMLNPRPRNFADPVEMARVTVDRMYQAIKEGRPGTAMAAWEKVLSETQIGDVIDYIHSLASPSGRPLTAEQLSLEVGRRLYVRECAVCHGVDGRADTEAAKVLHPPPSKFADPIEMARLDDGRIYSAIKLGRPGTAMGGWGELLSPVEIIDLMRYVRTLVQPPPAGTTAAQLDLLGGEQVYRQHCMVCHGEKGNAQTPLGQSLVPHPRDFTRVQEMASISDKDLAQAIALGKPGTAMAPWRGVLNSEDIRRVILFIRRTFQRAP
ncbi:MAG TPA: c-type cytochrome, partial [Candidatus Methylomirabilis sp.]|nr:c-type cytochrome [Candidatus Methylomirabilis sp.]